MSKRNQLIDKELVSETLENEDVKENQNETNSTTNLEENLEEIPEINLDENVEDIVTKDDNDDKNTMDSETTNSENESYMNSTDTIIEDFDEQIDKKLDENNEDHYSNDTKTKFKKAKKQKNEKNNKAFRVVKIVLITILCIILLSFAIFTIFNMFNTNIVSGVKIQGMDVSGMSKSDAKYQLDNYIAGKLPQEIKVKHGDFEATISLSQIEASFNTKAATDDAFKIGRDSNPFKNDFSVLSTMFNNVDITPEVTVNTDQLTKNLEEISAQLPDRVIESSYYQEDNNLIITAGKAGYSIDIEPTIEAIKNSISSFSCIDTPVELVVKTEQPEAIDIEKIHNEIYKEPVNAYYTTNPFTVYPSENGLDFKISVEEAKNLITSEAKEEYTIPLKTLYPSVSTSMIGTEAFPDQLSSFKTYYNTSNTDRTTNLRLAANKVNGTVLMPGETFSYNKIVGERTIAAGYKEAPIYVNGEVVDGIGGGICQVSSTIYNAVIYANLEIVSRRNHQFVPSYVTASRDATVVYGSTDFQFKNNRNYPIKIVCSVSGGVASVQIFGLKQDDDYDVEISSYITGQTATTTYSEAYKILKRNGKVVSKTLLSKDTYKRH